MELNDQDPRGTIFNEFVKERTKIITEFKKKKNDYGKLMLVTTT